MKNGVDTQGSGNTLGPGPWASSERSVRRSRFAEEELLHGVELLMDYKFLQGKIAIHLTTITRVISVVPIIY